MNDPILVTDFLTRFPKSNEITTIFPLEWEFYPLGNTILKRKRKHSSEITKQTKMVDWFIFTCQVWRVKFNRERRTYYINSLMSGTSFEEIEEIIKKKKNDDQKE